MRQALTPIITSNFNPRSPHGERRKRAIFKRRTLRISIHAPRTGSDGLWLSYRTSYLTFQSTLPARGATLFLFIVSYALKFQSTLPARGAT